MKPRPPSLIRLQRSPLMHLIARVLVLTLLSWSLPFDAALPARAAATESAPEAAGTVAGILPITLYVNADASAACGGKAPCFTTIQGAIDAVAAGQRIEIQAGTYVEQLEIRRKNASARATEADRIVIEADPAAPPGSVVLRGRGARCEAGYAIEIARSKYVTIRGLTIVGAGGRGIGLRGGSLESTGIHLERNRIGRGGPRECNGGIDVGRGNPQTVIANNLIHGNGRNGIRFRDGRGGSYYVVGNTIARNAWSGIQITHAAVVELVNNVVVGNGTAAGAARTRVGVRRLKTSPSPASQVRLRGNLVCGNAGGELEGPLLDATDAGNLTPTGLEGPGVAASATCGDLAALFRDADGADDAAETADDDFRLAAGSAAIDAGVDPRLLGMPAAHVVLEADFDGANARPRDGDGNDTAEFDAGAHEGAGEVQPSPTPSASPSPSPSMSPTPSASPSPSPSPSPAPSPTIAPNRLPTIVSTPVTRIVVEVPEVDPPEPSFDFIELVPGDVGSSRGDVFTTLPTTDPTVFGFTGSDVRKVNFDTTPGGAPLSSGVQLTSEYASLGVLMSSIPISSGVFGGAASPPNATYIGPVGGQQSFTFTVPVVAVGIINTSPDQDRIAFYSPSGELMFTIRDQDALPGPNFNVDRFVGARVTDSNLIGSIVFQNEAGNDEFDELIFEVSTAQLPKADYVYDCDATDPDLDTLTYFLLQGPAGMQIDPATGRVTWTPTSLDVGTHAVKIRVEDGRGGFDEQEYQLEVVEQPVVPNVVGQQQPGAGATIAAAGFTVGTVTTRHDPQPAGTVVGQTPLGGSRAPAGSSIDVVVSLGPEPLPTPSPSPSPTPLPPLPPVASPDAYDVDAGDVLHVTAPGVLANDDDPNDDPLTAMLVRGPASGELVLRSDGSFDYDPLGSRGQAFVYCEDFQSASASLAPWSASSLYTATGGRRALGRFGNETVRLALAGLPSHQQVTVAFQLWANGSWDGNGPGNGPDVFRVRSGGADLIATTFSNGAQRQAFPGAYPGGDNAAFAGAAETNAAGSVYSLSASFAHTGSTLDVDFVGEGLQVLTDESWALDNVCVSIGAPLEPVLERQRTSFEGVPGANQIMMAPVVGDLNDDGTPDVVVTTYPGGTWFADGVLRAFSGAPVPVVGGNLVRRDTVTVSASSSFNAYLPARGIDGDLDTSWFSARPDPNASYTIEFPSDVVVEEIRYYGNREFPDGYDFTAGRFTVLAADGTVLHDSGEVTLPAPTRDVVVDVGRVEGARRVTFTATGFERPGSDHGFAEIQVIGDGPDPLSQLWAVTNPQHQLYSGAGIALGDIDLDGKPEIVALHEDGTLIAFEHDGAFKWKGSVVTAVGWGAPSIADLDQDGVPEIVAAGAAFDNLGNRLWDASSVGGAGRGGRGGSYVSTVADIDLDGRPEVVAGRSAYRWNGALMWNASIPDGYPAVANFDDDDEAEIAVVTNGTVYLLEHTGAVKWGPVAIPGSGFGGPPTIADVDGDGLPEIGVAGANNYVVFEHDGTIKWVQPTRDATSNSTGSAVFDFDGDGTAEIVYADEYFLRIYRGATGEVLYALALGSGTTAELPAIADVDGDGHAEIVAIANQYLGGNAKQGLFIVGGAGDTWVSTRKLWNQHDYHVTNVNDDLSIPRVERANWLTAGLNDFRRNSFSPDDQQRTETFVYQAVDAGGLASADTPVTIEIRSPNGPPDIVSQPQAAAYVGVAYTYAAQATDPDVGDELRWFLLDGPDGMTIGQSDGLVTWTPDPDDLGGSFDVTIRVQDLRGLADLQSFGLTVAVAPTPSPTPVPTVTPVPTATATPTPTATAPPTPTPAGPTPTPTPVRVIASIAVQPASDGVVVGDTRAFHAVATFADGSGGDVTASVSWSSGTPAVATVDAGGVASGLAPGSTTITATSGAVSGSAQLSVLASVPGDGTLPVAAITAPAANAQVTAPTNVVGTASDANLVRYELDLAPAGETTFTRIATGATAVSNGVLGELDPTLLLNGPYTLRLRVYDAGGNVAEASTVVVAARELKLGLYSVSFTDLEVALSGIPITVTRTYDNRDKSKGDFGVGWRVDVRTVRARTNRVLGTGWTTQNAGFNVQLVPLDQHYVTITLADGTVETFDLQLSPMAQPFSLDATNVVGFAPRPGTLGTLQPLDNGSLLVVPAGAEVELWDDLTFRTYDPRRFRYTTKDGEKVVIDRVTGVESITDLNGNTVTFGASSITHSSGVGLSLVRDGQGRITQITDPSGGVQTYAYDAAGDLRSHTNAVGAATTFSYDDAHNLTGIVDPSGAPIARNDYDADGRLIATVDARGNRVEIEHDLGAMQQIVRDRLGNPTVYGYDAAGNITSKLDALNGLTTYTYDSRGNRLSETDPLGRTATSTYDARDNVLSRTDFDGNTTTSTYNARGKALTVTDPEGRTTTNVYDANDNLLQTTSPEGGVTSNTYDARGNRLTMTDPLGNVTTFTYDAAGRQLTSTDPLGNVTTRTYDASGRTLSETDPQGTVSTTFDLAGRQLTSTDPLGGQRALTYSPIGDGTRVASLAGPGGNVSGLGYDANGQATDRTFPGGAGDAVVHDAAGRVASSTDRDGRTTSYEYDALGRQTKIVHPDGSTVVATYDAVGRMLTRTDERGHTTTWTYGPNTQTVTDPLGNVTVHELDSRGRRVKTTDALGRETTYAYDSAGNLTSTTFDDGSTFAATYDDAGRKTSETDQAGRTTEYAYDPLGRLVKVTDALGGMTTYTHDFAGNLLSQTDANGHATTMTYDALGRLLTRTRPLGQTETFTHDVRGHLATRTDFGGATTTFVHDALGRLVQKTLPDATVIPYAYTAAGLRTQAGGDTYEYDARGRLVKETKSSGEVLTYTWDAAGNRTSVTTPQGTTTFGWDELNRIETVTDATGTTTYGYDDVGNLVSTAYPNGTDTAYAYDALNRLTSVVNTGPGGLVSSYTYTLGPAGNRTQVVEAGPATGGRTITYAYDALYRLTGETIDAPGTANDLAIAYVYDAVGNRTQMTRGAVVTTYTYDANDRLLTQTAPGDTVDFAYDADGNLVSRDDGANLDLYVYDAEDRLVEATVESGANPGVVAYAYDADGLRTSRTSSGITTTYLQDKSVEHARVLVEQEPGVVTTYTWGNELVAQTRGGTGTRFHLVDGQLSVRQLTTTAGAVSDTYDYDAFGVLLSSSGSTTNEYRYAGEPLDPNVGFHYLRARWYDQATGRFTSTDPEQGNVFDPVSLHRYLYANANPVDNRDPSGRVSLASSMVALAIETALVFALALVFTKDLKKAAIIARDNFLFGVLVIGVIFAAPLLFGAGAAAGGTTAAAAVAAKEGRLAIRIIKEIGEFMGESTVEMLMSRATKFIRDGNRAFDLLPSHVQKMLLEASPKVLNAIEEFVAALKPLTTLPGTTFFFRSKAAIKEFQEFFAAVLKSIPK